MSNPNELVTYAQRTSGGKAFRCSRRTAAHLDDTKAALARQHPGATLVIIQGCYNTGVSASAGTHDYDACLDVYIPALGWWDAQRFLREQGWAAWYRYPPAFGRHIHMVSLGFTTTVGKYVDGGLSLYGRKTTSSQVDDYYAHRTGLAGHAADTSWRPDDIRATVYHYTEKDWFDMATKKDLEQAVEAAVGKQLDRIEKLSAATNGSQGRNESNHTRLDNVYRELADLAAKVDALTEKVSK